LHACRVHFGRANNERLTHNTQVDESNGVIQFNGITEEEQGDYVCTAVNSAGTVTALAIVRVEGELLELLRIYSRKKKAASRLILTATIIAHCKIINQ
jgi:hypothetical protein